MAKYINIKKSKILLSLIFLFFFFPLIGLALIPQIDYPEVMGIDINDLINSGAINLTQLGQYFYYFFIIIGGVVAFWGLVSGGFQWLTSAGSPGKLREAKNQIISSFLGIIILLSSWVILYTLDPSLITFHAFPASVEPAAAEPASREATELTDGFLLYTSDPDHPIIPEPKGRLQPVEDTTRFPLGGRTIDLGGLLMGGAIRRLERVEFLNPIAYDIVCDRDPTTGDIIPGTCCERDGNGDIVPGRCCQTDVDGNIIQGTCEVTYYYGLICFSETHFRGLAEVITSYQNTEHTLLGLFADQGLPDQFCRSLYAFKQPAIPIYARGDQVLFYEQDFPVDKDPETQALIGGACIKVDTDADPEGCRNSNLHLNTLNQDYKNVNGVFEIPSLCGLTEDENGNVIDPNGWFPLSMQITADRDRKYLVMLYQGGEDCQGNDVGPTPQTRGPFQGNAYKLDRDVPDFSDPQDIRLYWVRTGQDPLPRSAQILPIEPIE